MQNSNSGLLHFLNVVCQGKMSGQMEVRIIYFCGYLELSLDVKLVKG